MQLVNVTATVLDESGTYVDGLKQEDFQVYEDGAEQKVSFFSHDRRIPVSQVGVMVDISGSMRHKLQQALHRTAREISLALSDQDGNVPADIQFRRRHAAASDQQQGFDRAGSSGDPNQWRYFRVRCDPGGSRRNEIRAQYEKIMVLISDGFDSRSKLTLPQVEELLKRAEVEIYAIGIDDDENDPLVVVQPGYTTSITTC